jgi:hypothetical protein
MLRGVAGTLTWLSKETRSDLMGETALLQQSVPGAKRHMMREANATLKKAASTLSVEILSMLQGSGRALLVRALLHEAFYPEVPLTGWEDAMIEIPVVLVTEAKLTKEVKSDIMR